MNSKKICAVIFAALLTLSATGCGKDKKKEKDTSSKSSQQSVESESKETSVAEATTETTEQITTEESTTEPLKPENEMQLLDIDKELLHESVSSVEYAETLTEMDCSTARLGKNAAKRYPELAQSLINNGDFYEVNMLEANDMLAESAEEILSSGAEGFDTFVRNLDVHVRRADNIAVSILHDSYNYDGMSDGNRNFWGDNYDTETGETIYIPDVVTDIDKFAETVETKLFSTMGADVFYSDTVITNYFKDYGADGINWTLEYNGVTIYFDEGEIANSGFGNISITIEFAEHPELFKKKYTDIPEAYIVGLPMKSTFFTDLDGDGSCDELTLSDSYDEESGLNRTLTLYISTSDVDYTESFMANDCESYYVKTADGRNYLYVLIELETQSKLYTFEITNTIISKVGEQPISPYYSEEVSSVLTDPDNMHFDIFGKDAGIPVGDDFFSVGADGMPVMK